MKVFTAKTIFCGDSEVDAGGAWPGGYGEKEEAHGGMGGGIIDFYARDGADWRERADGAGVCGVSAGGERASAG